MNNYKKLLPRGFLSSRKKLRELSRAIDIREPKDLESKFEPVFHPSTESSWNKTVLLVHNSIKS